MSKHIVWRNERTGKFSRPHKQKYLRAEIQEREGRKVSSHVIGNYHRGVDEFEAWTLEQTYTVPVWTVQPDIVLHSFKSLHRTLQPVQDQLKTYKLVDVEVWYKGEKIVSLAKIPLVKTGRKKLSRWGRRWTNESPLDRIRIMIKRSLEEQGYAITSKQIRLQWGDKRTKTYAVDKIDEETGKVIRRGLKTIKPKIIIRGYK